MTLTRHAQFSCEAHRRSMNTETRLLLVRWQALERGDGLRRAGSTARALWLGGLVLFLFVALAVVYSLHPAYVAVAAAVMGWTIAEMNALRKRAAQWPIFAKYVDWERVKRDLDDDTSGS
jgi:hypothetical protein